MAVAGQQPVSPQVVGNAFVQQYYQILHHSPALVHRFYLDISKLGRPEEDGSMSITTTMQAINDKIISLNYDAFHTEIKSVDAQDSYNGGVQVLVTGYLNGKDGAVRNFSQAFFLAPQDKGYFVLNDIFRYVDNAILNPTLVSDVVSPIAAEPDPAPVLENQASEQSTKPAEDTDSGEEVYNPPEQDDVPPEEELPVGEVIEEAHDDTQLVVESSSNVEEVPRKSYASIVMHLNVSAGSFSTPHHTPRKPPPRNVEQTKPSVPPPEATVHVTDSVDNDHVQEGEADGFSIYIRGLPMHASESLLEDVFKKFGTIKKDGIQVRNNRQQGFYFGFVEFEEASSVHKAIEASPIAIGGRQVYIEEKRSTNSRGSSRGRFQAGRGSGFRNGGRGGNYGSRGGGYIDGREEFGNRGVNRGGYMNGSGGGRMNRGGMAKNVAPRVSASA